MSKDKEHFPLRTQSHIIEYASLNILRDQLPCRWIVRTNRGDYGLDGEIEIVSRNGVVKGDIFKFQIKGHRKVHPKKQHVIQRVYVSTINYWLQVPLPVILFFVDVDKRIVYWVDIKTYIRDTLSVVRTNWRNQTTTQFKIPIENKFPDSLAGINEVVLSYKEQLKSYQIALEELEEETVVTDFISYHIFIHLYDGNINAWERFLRHKGSDSQLLNDFPFVVWLKDQLKKDKDLINRIRRLVRDTTPKVFTSLLKEDYKESKDK